MQTLSEIRERNGSVSLLRTERCSRRRRFGEPGEAAVIATGFRSASCPEVERARLPYRSPGRERPPAVALGVSKLFAIACLTACPPPPPENRPPQAATAETQTIQTHLYRLRSESFRFAPSPGLGRAAAVLGLAPSAGFGRAVEVLGSDLLIATRSGRFVLMSPEGEFRYFDERVPMVEAGVERVSEETRVSDILLREQSPGRFDLFVSHHYTTGECTRFRVSSASLEREGNEVEFGEWRGVFDANPCLPPDSHWNEAGGPMLTDGPDHLLVVVGNHGAGAEILLESLRGDELHLGKVLRVEIRTGAVETLTRGHRNPQGLARDAAGALWSVEHGPRGGDELNLLEPGRKYGHPRASYGLPYAYPGFPTARLAGADGRHDEFTRPMFAWAPSPGLSALVVNDAAAFPLWDDDLLIASLGGTSYIEGVPGGRSLFRVRRVGRTVQYVERILLGVAGIHDLAFLPDGRLALLSREIVRLLSFTSDPVRASCPATDLFASRCAQCHSLRQETHRAGPHLVGAIGRRAGSVVGFDGFSEALRSLDRDWTAADLEQYLVDPQGFAPGTVKAGATTPEEARQLVRLIAGGPEQVGNVRVNEERNGGGTLLDRFRASWRRWTWRREFPLNGAATLFHRFRGLAPGQEYEVQLRRWDANGRVAHSEAVTATADPEGRVGLLWDAPAPDVCAIQQFRLRGSGEVEWREWREIEFR